MALNQNKLSDQDYTELGRAVERIIRKDYIELALNKRRLLAVSLLRGLAIGFGSVLGATILVGLVLWVLSLFDTAPVIGEWINDIRQTIEQ